MSGILTKKIRKINDSFGLNGLEMRETGRLLGCLAWYLDCSSLAGNLRKCWLDGEYYSLFK